MSLQLPCVTTWVGRGGCRIPGEHLSNCIGIQPRGNDVVPCDGCLPQPAEKGVMCSWCFERYEAALGLAEDLITHMRSIERAATPEDGPRPPTKPGSQVLIPASWQEADRTWSELHELAVWCDPLEFLRVQPRGTTSRGFGSQDTIEHVRDRVKLAVDLACTGDVTDAHIARLAVRFYRQVQRALHMFPIEEYARPLPYARCRECGELTLERRPPLEYLDAITVLCINPNCQLEWDPRMVEFDLSAYREQLETEQQEETEGAVA